MNLADLLDNIDVVQVAGKADFTNVDFITFNSKKVKSKTIFVAIKGYKTDGHKFIPQALSQGAAAVVIDNNDAVADNLIERSGAVKIVVNNSRIALAQISNFLYGQPSKHLTLIGITGTKGKTTTAFYLKNILEQSGAKVGLIGTMKNMVADKEIPTNLTTPEANTINSLMKDMVEAGCKYCVMEVSSHSLELHRVDYLDFDVAVFTNLQSDHLDFHKTRENYLQAKKILFDNLKETGKVVYNFDDEAKDKLFESMVAEMHSYGENEKAEIVLSDIHYTFEGTHFAIKLNGETINISTKLIGTFNAYNAAAALATANCLGISLNDAIKGIENLPQIAGRFEVIKSGEKVVIIDFSHTAGSLKQALLAANEIAAEYNPKKNIYTVFGCGGNRDKTKRPIMGKYASELSKKVFATSDNPRDEDPFLILKDIQSGITYNNYEIIEDREEAIRKAISEAEDDAVILIAGKGHENYQLVKGIKTHFSDKEVAEKYLSAKKNATEEIL